MADGQSTIKKPSTSKDDGTPSISCVNDVERVMRFIEDERHLIAKGLYQSVLERIRKSASPSSPPPKQKHRFRKSKASIEQESTIQDIQRAQELISSKKDVLENLEVCFMFSCLSRKLHGPHAVLCLKCLSRLFRYSLETLSSF